MYKTVIFDLDGTLVDTAEAVVRTLTKFVCRETGKICRREEVLRVFGMPSDVCIERLGVDHKVENLQRQLVEILNRDPKNRVYPGMEETLRELAARKIDLAICTARFEDEVFLDRPTKRLIPYFSQITYTGMGYPSKPAPDLLWKIIEERGISREEALFIGDSEVDVACAKAAGIDFGLAAWGNGAVLREGYRYRFERPREVLDIIDK